MTTGSGHWLIEQSKAERKIKKTPKPQVIKVIGILLKSLMNKVLLGGMYLVTSCTGSTPGLHCPAD